MPIAESSRYKLYQPTVETTEFPVPFAIADDGDLEVTVGGVVTATFSVTSTYINGFSSDAVVVLSAATTKDVEILGKRAPRQENTYLASSPDLAEQLEYAVDLVTITQQEQQRDVQNAADAKASASAAAAAAELAAAYDGPNFDTAEALRTDTGLTYNDVSVGDIVYVKDGGLPFEVAEDNATDHDVTNSAAIPVKMYYRPVYTAVPQALGRVGLLTGGFPAVDESATLQACLDIAAREGVPFDLRGFKYRSEKTLHLNGCSVITGSGGEILFPSSGTYDRWRNDADDGNITDTMTCAFDVSGGAFIWHGQIKLKGVDGLEKFTSVQRATVDQNLAALGGVTSSIAEMTCTGQLVCEGFAHWAYVPSTEAGFGSRQFARINGQYRSRFNLSPIGWFGAGANGLDDSNVHLRVDRCGGYGDVTESKINGTELNCNYFFGTGLTDKTANKDWEDTTASVTHDSTALVLSGAGSSVLDAGDFIVILDAYERSTDGEAIPLVAKIASKTDNNNFVLESKTRPNLPSAGSAGDLNWFYRPPRIKLSNAHFTARSGYPEGYWDCIELEDNCVLKLTADLKGGGVRLSGRHGAIINTTGLNNSISFEGHRTLGLSNGLESVIAYGAVRYNENKVPDDEYDAPLYARVVWPWQKEVTQTASYTLNYDARTGAFTEGLTLTGSTSGATATIRIVTPDDGDPTVGTLRLTDISGTFQDDETITDSSTGSATANGTPTAVALAVLTPEVLPIKAVDPVEFFSNDRVAKFTYQLNYDAETSGFTEGETLTGGTSGATATIVSFTDNGTDGTLVIEDISGTFQDNETITDGAGGSATSDGAVLQSMSPMFRNNVVVDYTTGQERGFFNASGTFKTRTFVDGLSYQGSLVLDPGATIGTQTSVVDITTSATTIYDADTLAPGSGYRVFGTSGDNLNTVDGLFSVEDDGTVHVDPDNNGNSFLTFTASGTELQAALASDSASVRFSLIGRV